jgi:hypothetical protein
MQGPKNHKGTIFNQGVRILSSWFWSRFQFLFWVTWCKPTVNYPLTPTSKPFFPQLFFSKIGVLVPTLKPNLASFLVPILKTRPDLGLILAKLGNHPTLGET